MQKNNYGLFTATTMITGIVIGSGIFFKSDDILAYTNGNMLLGIFIFIVAAIAIIFGCLAMAQLASRTDKPGGIVAYAEEFINIRISAAYGWFYIFLYMPTLVAVIGWVSGMYVCQLFGIAGSNITYTLIGFCIIVLLFITNMLSAKYGGAFQNAAMIIKLIPLVILGVVGVTIGKPITVLSHDMEMIRNATIGTSFIAAFAPIAFSFDGWVVATSISHEIKNSKRNLPLALTFAPIIILLVYVLYFVGVTSLVGPEEVLIQGNDSAYTAAKMIVGPAAAKGMLVFIVISILGTLNGLILGYIRMPYSLALRKMIPGSNSISKESKRFGNMPLNSAVFALLTCIVWFVIHFITMEKGMRSDVSEISISISYLNYILLYLVVIRLKNKGEIKSFFWGYIVPVMAILGSLVILSGSITHPLFPLYLIICYGVMGVGYYYSRHVK